MTGAGHLARVAGECATSVQVRPTRVPLEGVVVCVHAFLFFNGDVVTNSFCSVKTVLRLRACLALQAEKGTELAILLRMCVRAHFDVMLNAGACAS
jgi:hypothetical protein